MKRIPLSGGKAFALVDDDLFALISRFSWQLNKRGYAETKLRMGDLVLGKSAHLLIDHIDGDRLDNRRENLRYASHQQNAFNRAKSPGCSSVFKGVHHKALGRRWIAQIEFDGKGRHIGSFQTEHQAAIAYDLWALSSFGEFAKTNFKPVFNGP